MELVVICIVLLLVFLFIVSAIADGSDYDGPDW